MALLDINPNLPCLRPLTTMRGQYRHMSLSSNSKSNSSSSSSSSNKSNDSNCLPILIQLCLYPDEKYSLATMRSLFNSSSHYSPNVTDDFGCNALMYSLRYQRFRLFEFLLEETSIDLNLGAKDRQGNNILHYAVLYDGYQLGILENLIEKFLLFKIDIDQRNQFGFTPLLLAIFCGRYDLAMLLLTKTDASPFVRDDIQQNNLIDYLETDLKYHQEPKSRPMSSSSAESNRLLVQLHQCLPFRRDSSSSTHYPMKNFFQTIFPQAVHDSSEVIRSSMIKAMENKYSLSHLTSLLNYFHRRYPRIKTARQKSHLPDHRINQQRPNSKTNVHQILSLFDPGLRPKVTPPRTTAMKFSQPTVTPSMKPPMTFKRLSTKITTIAAFSRVNGDKKRS